MTECDQRFNEAKVMFNVLIIATLSVSLPAQHTHTYTYAARTLNTLALGFK